MIGIAILAVLYLDTTAAYYFQEEPEDANAIVGMAVTLRCVVRNWGSMDVLWYDHGKDRYVSKDEAIYQYSDYSDRFSITGNSQVGEYFMHIRNLTSEDAGLYGCLMFQDRSFRLSSRDALLQVFPEPRFPVCSIIPDVTSGGTGPGDWIRLECVAEGGSPFSRLDWVRSLEILPASFLEENEPRSIYEFRLSEYHNGAVFSCVESNPIVDHTRSCSVMPFYHPTNVTLKLQPLRPVVGRDVTLRCEVQSLPLYNLNYTWLLNGDDISLYTEDERVSLSDDRSRLTFQSVGVNFNASLLECYVVNIIELDGKASLQLLLEEETILAKSTPVVTESNGPVTALLLGVLGVTFAIIILLVLLIIILSYRRKRVGFLHLLKARRSSLSRRYHEHQRYTRTTETVESPRNEDSESIHSVLICATPRDAIQTHIRELKGQQSGSEKPGEVTVTRPPRPSDGSQVARTSVVFQRGRNRPTISGPISPVVPDLQVPLRDLHVTVNNADTASEDEDYVSDVDAQRSL